MAFATCKARAKPSAPEQGEGTLPSKHCNKRVVVPSNDERRNDESSYAGSNAGLRSRYHGTEQVRASLARSGKPPIA